MTEFGVDVGDGVCRHDHVEVPDIGIERAVQNALLGDLPGEHHPLSSEPSEQIVKRRRVKHAVANLGQKSQASVGTIGFTKSGRSPARAERTMSLGSALKSP